MRTSRIYTPREPVKFAFCLFKFFPFGGLQRDFLAIARECLRRGHTVDVYTMSWEGELEPSLSVTIIPLKARQNHSRAQQFVAQLQPYLQQGQYDALIGFNKIPGLDVYYAADTCYQAKIKTQRHPWLRFLPRYRHLLAYEKAVFAPDTHTTILALSRQQQAEFIHSYATPSERFHFLPPGISQDRKAPANCLAIRASLRKELGLAEADFLLLMVGSGFKTKGLDRIIAGVAALPEAIKARCQVFVVGQDQARPFRKLAQKLKIENRLHFLGGRLDAPRFFLAADILLHPAYNENTGTVLLEAIIAGLPVLTTDVCGYASYVLEAEAGIVLSSPFQQAAFNQSLLEMLLSQKREIWQRNGLAFAEHADLYHLPHYAVNVIESICN